MKRNYRAIIQYEGTRYQGWQKQVSTDNTIQGKLESLLSKMVDQPVEVNSSGRTDAGVHAYGQVISFSCDTDKSTEEILEYMNQYLPEDIGVQSVVVAGDRFHARLNATGKIYRYRVLNSKIPKVFDRRYVFQVPEELDKEAIKKGISYLEGKHDFKAFTAKKNTKKSTVRTIHEIKMEQVGEELIFTFYGDGFLYHMVRILMGTLLEIGQHRRTPESILEALESGERVKAGFLAPAQGLALMQVFYD
ncbi:MAG: tRNA pseudouridine(38-40) synthase TruA [Lachnospiraceae bacterium]|nr:tRNA pseudouridine(38-40) synthase TruA [Lachnospiraceae bacterium]